MFNGHHYSEQRHNDGEVKKLQALTTWITNIVLFILLATIINLLLPNSSFQKYTKLVVGLLLMLIIITPVFQIFKVDVNQMLKSLSLSSIRSDQQVENSIENQKKEIQASQRAYILEQMAVQMEADVKEELMDQYGVAIDRIHIETKKPNDEPTADNIKSISVAVSKKASDDSEVVSAVKVISIDTSTPIETNKPTESKKLSNYLAAKWDVKQGQVVVNMEEGDKMSQKPEKGDPSFFQRFFSLKQSSTTKKPSKLMYIGILLAAGVIFMVFSNSLTTSMNSGGLLKSASKETSAPPVSQDVPAFSSKKTTTMTGYEERYEEELKDILDQLRGVSKVKVIVNLDATESKIYEKNSVTKSQTTNETDREGGTRKVEDSSTDEQLVIVRSGEQEKPVVVKTEKPKVRGVLVVAKGADNIEVKKSIIEAVTRALDIPSHRVAVLAKKG